MDYLTWEIAQAAGLPTLEEKRKQLNEYREELANPRDLDPILLGEIIFKFFAHHGRFYTDQEEAGPDHVGPVALYPEGGSAAPGAAQGVHDDPEQAVQGARQGPHQRLSGALDADPEEDMPYHDQEGGLRG